MQGSGKAQWEPINFVFYLSFIGWPVAISIAAEIALRLAMADYLPDLSLDRVDLFMWIVRLCAFAYIGWKIGRSYGEVPPMGAIAGAIGGIAIGLAIAIFRFASGFHTWKIFNLVTETTLAALVGGLAAFLVVYIWDMLPDKMRRL